MISNNRATLLESIKRVMNKILVTGAKGLLGSHLIPYLKASGHEVISHSRRGGVSADLTDMGQVTTALNEVAPEVIINLAACTSVDECEKHPQHAYLANTRIVENLVNWIKISGKNCHLVQISTDQVYDGNGSHRESDVTLTNYYGFSKYAGELAASAVSSTILRTNFFGPSCCPGRVSLSDWLIQALSKGEQITVFDDVHFSPLSIQRLVGLVELVAVHRRQGIYNLGSKAGLSKADFSFILAEVLGLPTRSMTRGTSDWLKLSAYRPKNMCMDSTYFEKTYGVKLPTLIEEIHSMKDAYAQQA